MRKLKFKQFLAATLAATMLLSTNAFATPIDLDNTPADATKTDTLDKTNGTDHFADETTNVWQNGSIDEEVRVNVNRASFFDITIPKEIVLNGNNGSANYEVSITGELAGDQALVVKPDDSFTLREDGGKTTPVTVTQDKDTFNYQDINNSEKGNGTLSAPQISAGNWSGSFYFNIEFKDNNNKIHIHNADKTTKVTKSWELVSGDFSQDGNTWTSTNKDSYSTGTATWTITLEQDVEISIPYNVSAQSKYADYDNFTIQLDNTKIVNEISGTQSDTYTTILSKGTHTIIATYNKARSSNDEVQLTLNDVLETTYGCSNCEHIHELITEITKEPTFTETGIKTIKCNTCNYSKTKIIPIKEKTFNDYTWAEIAAISEVGNAASMFKVGDEKELQIGSETYHVQILGFNHDDKSDGTGKAGITVGLKEIMTTKHVMNSTKTNVGGWKTSEMRTYLQNNILPTLPSDLQTVIKTVNKVSDAGNKDTTTLNTTQDKLFLFSPEEVGFSFGVSGQGTKYDYFTNHISRTKTYLSGNFDDWWLRSANTYNTYDFHGVNGYGDGYNNIANNAYGVVFGFSI